MFRRVTSTTRLVRVLLAAVMTVSGLMAVQTPARADEALVVAGPSDPQLGSLFAFRAGNYPWIWGVFEPLIKIDEKGKVQPNVASRWTLSSNKLTMTLFLKRGITFHNGKKLTAEDVKYSIEQAALATNGSQLGFIARSFASVDAVTDGKLVINFGAPTSNIFDLLSIMPIMPKNSYPETKLGKTVIGSGPFTWESWTPGAQVVIKKYPKYRDAARINLSQITVRIITNASAQLTALKSGAIDLAFGLSTVDAYALRNDANYKLIYAGGAIVPLGLDTSKAPFNNIKVRQAVGYAIDKNRINKQVFSDTGLETSLFWAPRESGYPKALQDAYTYNPTKAKALIAEAGAAGAEFDLQTLNLPANAALVEIVANNLRDIGLKPNVRVLDVTAWDAKQVAGDIANAFIPYHGQYGLNAATLLNSLATLRVEKGTTKFATAEYVKLRNAVAAAATSGAKEKALNNLSKFMVEQAFAMPIVMAPSMFVHSKKLTGVEFGELGHTFWNSAKLG
ncbi:MAG: Hemin-binding lipoprotein [Actinomycetota bacterium]